MINEIANYRLDEIELGLKKQFNVTVSKSMVEDFAKLSGDYNPLHMDEKYAKSTKFERRICHGMLLASFFSRLAGMYLPGEKSLYFSQSLKFLSPCFLGEKITIHGTVISKSNSTRIITLETTITNDSGVNLVRGEAKVMVRK